MRILVIDSFDSFTFNLVHTLETHPRVHCTVMTNNAIDWTALTAFNAVVLSPGPGIPEEAGDLITFLASGRGGFINGASINFDGGVAPVV